MVVPFNVKDNKKILFAKERIGMELGRWGVGEALGEVRGR